MATLNKKVVKENFCVCEGAILLENVAIEVVVVVVVVEQQTVASSSSRRQNTRTAPRGTLIDK